MKILSLLLLCACESATHDYMLNRILHHSEKVESFQGLITEEWGPETQSQRSEIFYSKPKFYSEIKSVGPMQGSWVLYNGEQLIIYYPKTNFAFEYKNLEAINPQQVQKLIQDRFDLDMNLYKFSLGDKLQVADKEAVKISFKAKSADSLIQNGIAYVYDPLSFPLFHYAEFHSGQSYSHKFEKIEFNQAIATNIFNKSLPKNSITSLWDLKSKNYSEKEVAAETGLKVRTPMTIIKDLKLEKIIRQKGPIPAFSYIYQSQPYFLFMNVVKDMKANFIPQGPHLNLKTLKHNGSMSFFSHIIIYSFTEKDVIYTLTTNLPLEQAIDVFDSI